MERRSFAIYFHTVEVPDSETALPHKSIYAPTFYRERPEIRDIVRGCITPILLRRVQKVRDK